MAIGELTAERHDDRESPAPSPSVADLRITELEQRLRAEPPPSPEETSQLRARLASLYLVDLGDPLGATVHIEELLSEKTVVPEALELATRLLDVKTVAGRIAKRLSLAYRRLGRPVEEAATLNRELKLAKTTRLDEVKRRLADLRYGELGDPEGALELLEPLVAKHAADDALRARYLEIATKEGQTARAIKTLSRALASQKDPEKKAKVAYAVGCLWRAQGDARRAQGAFLEALGTKGEGEPVVASARSLLELDPTSGEVRALVLETMARLGRPLDTPELTRVALSEVDALVASGHPDRALELCRRTLDDSPGSTDVLARFEELGKAGAAPEERRLRLARAVPLMADREARLTAMHRLAEIEAGELSNLPAALEIWRKILAEYPADRRAEEALLDAYEQAGDREAVLGEIESALGTFDGAARHGLLLRKARILGRQGDREGALSAVAELLDAPDLADSLIEPIAEVAYDEDDSALYQRALERQATLEDPALRVRALERLGDFHFERMGNASAAVDSWKPAARLVAKGGEEGPHAEELYERVLQASPDDCEAAENLLRLYVRSGRWAGIPEVYAVLLRAGREPERVVGILLDLEEGATRSGAVDDFVSMVDEAIPVTCAEKGPLLHRLMRAKARTLSADPARQDAASSAYQALLHSSGSEEDLRAYRRFIDSRPSADERQRDLRWWFGFQVSLGGDPLPLLLDWAKAEEDYGDVDAAIAVYERVVQADPTRADALRALARLAAGHGDFEKSLTALRTLKERIAPESAGEIDLGIATILMDELDRPLEAVNIAVPLLERPPLADSALEIVLRGVSALPAEAELWDAVRQVALERRDPELLVRAFRRSLGLGRIEPDRVESLGRRVVEFQDECSSDAARVVETLEAVLEHAPAARWALDRVKLVLSRTGRWDELFERYDRAVTAAPTDRERADLLDEAVIVAKDLAGQAGRAIRYLEALRPLRPADAGVSATLERLCEREGETQKLIDLLSERALGAAPSARRALDQRIAGLLLDLGEVVSAQAVISGVVEREGGVLGIEPLLERIVRAGPAGEGRIDDLEPDPVLGASAWALALLKRHYSDSDQVPEQVRIAEAELGLLGGASRRSQAVEELVRLRIRAEGDAPGVFLRVLPRAVEDAGGERPLERTVFVALLDLARARLLAAEGSVAEDAAQAAWWVLHLLVERTLEDGESEAAAELLVDGARLPFGRPRQRELLGTAARIFADRAAAPDRAIGILRGLFDEDPGDDVACGSSERFDELLLDLGLDVERAMLAERLARALPGEASRASELWTRAAALWEAERNTARAIGAHSEGAALGARASIEAVARLHTAEGDLRAAAQALEWAFAESDDGPVALTLADLYVRLGERASARERLEVAVLRTPGQVALRERLAELYRDEELWEPLAELLAAGVEHTADPEERFRALGEAIGIELEKLGNPEGAIPLLRAALELRPGVPELEVALVDALELTDRFDEAAALLRAQIAVFADRRPKQRALLHHRLARVLLRSGDREEALRELDRAVDIDPTDPAILYDLGRLALDDGELEVADRTFRSLLLAVHHGASSGDAPGRVEVYLALGDVAARQGDSARADDLVESAFEAGLETPAEAIRLEEILEARGQHELLARAIERRLGSVTELPERTSALAELVRVHLSTGVGGADLAKSIASRIEEVCRDAERTRATSPDLWTAVSDMARSVGGEALRRAVVTRWVDALVVGDPAETRMDRLRTAADLARSELGDPDRAGEIQDTLVALLQAAIPKAKKKAEKRRLRLELVRLLVVTPGEVEPAVAALRALVEDDPTDTEALELLAQVLEREGKDDELVELLSARLRALGQDPEPSAFVAVASRLTAVLERAGRPEAALPLYEAIARVEPLDMDMLRSALQRLEALGSRELAGTLERVARRSTGPAAAELAGRLLALRDGQGDRAGIERALEIGFAADPSDARFRDRLVQGLADRGLGSEVVSVLERAHRAAPEDPAITLRLSEALCRAGDLPAALTALDSALGKSPADPALLSLRAGVHESLGSDDLAVLDLERSAARDAASSPALVGLLTRVVGRGSSPRLDEHALTLIDLLLPSDPALARSELDRLLERKPEHAPALERLAALLLAGGDVHGAVATYRRLLPLIRADGTALARAAAAFADACERTGRSTDARDALEEARRLAPEGREIRRRLEAVYEAAGEHLRLAELVLEDVADARGPQERAVLLRRAAALFQRDGRAADRALRALEEARQADPDSPDGLLLLAEAWSGRGRSAEALHLLLEWTETKKSKSGPGAARVYLEIAKHRLEGDEIFEAFDALERSFTHDPKNVEASLLLGLVAMDLDDEKAATRALRAITASRTDKVAPESKAVAFYHLARLADRRGDKRSARLMATHAVAENPAHAEARALLDALGR